MNQASTITHADSEITATTIRLKSELWNRTRKLAIDLGISANQIVNEGLEQRLAQLEGVMESVPGHASSGNAAAGLSKDAKPPAKQP